MQALEKVVHARDAEAMTVAVAVAVQGPEGA